MLAGFAHLDAQGRHSPDIRRRRLALGNRLSRVEGRLFRLRQYKLPFK